MSKYWYHDDQMVGAGRTPATPLAPFEVTLLSLQPSDDQVRQLSDRLYDELTAAGVEVLYDDRDDRPGVKFKDADLIGIPLRITIGAKGLKDGIIELKARTSKDVQKILLAEAEARISAAVAEAQAKAS